MKSESVCAVVVTHNRFTLLLETIAGLRKQIRSVDNIIVVDNASTDETNEWLKLQDDLDVITQENLGGAGGFNSGIKLAINKKYSWIWVMDDDVVPEPDCLFELLKAYETSMGIYKVLQPSRYFSEDRSARWQYGNEINKCNPFKSWCFKKKNSSVKNSSDVVPIKSFPFEGPIFRHEVIVDVGDVDMSYFITYDDADYSMRVLRAGYKVGMVRDALLCKKIGYKQKGLKNDFKLYYSVRNGLIFELKFFPLWIAITRNFFNALRISAVFIKQGIQNRDLIESFSAIKVISKAFFDGIKNNNS